MRSRTDGRLLVCFCWTLLLTASAQEPRSEAAGQLVLCRVSVFDEKTGSPIPDLEPQDLILYVGDRRREIRSFERMVADLDLVVLLDASSQPHESRLKSADVRVAVEQSLHVADRVAVIAFATAPRLVASWSSSASAIPRAFEEVERMRTQHPSSRGRIIKALGAGERLLVAEPADRRRARVILAITHNEEEADEEERGSLTKRLLAADIVLSGLFVQRCDWWPRVQPTRPWQLPLPRMAGQPMQCIERPNRHTIDPIALATGGELGLASTSSGEFLRSALERIRCRYLLGFVPEESGLTGSEVRRLKVELAPAAKRRHPTAVVRHRVGYILRPTGGGAGRNRRRARTTPATLAC